MAENVISFNRGVPPEKSFPIDWLADCTATALNEDGAVILQYGNPAGYPPLVERLAESLKVDESQIIIGQGSLQLLDFLVKSDESNALNIFVEQPTYDRPLTIFKRAAIKLSSFQLKRGRLSLEEIENSLTSVIPDYFYIIPDFQNPSGAVMPLEDRKRITALAKRYRFTLIEDATYRELRYTGKQLPSLFELMPGSVIYMSSFSKLISPGLRVGYMAGEPQHIQRLKEYAQNTYISGTFLSQAAIYQFIKKGLLSKQLEMLKKLYASRLSVLQNALEAQLSHAANWIEPEGGFFVGVFLKEDYQLAPLEQCRDAGLGLFDSKKFFLEGGENFIRLPFCALSEVEIEEGVKRLAGLITKLD